MLRRMSDLTEPGSPATPETASPAAVDARDAAEVNEHVAEEQDIEDAARMIAEGLDEVLQRRMLVLETAELVRFEREQRGLQAGEESGSEDQCADEQQEQSEEESGHSAPWSRVVYSCGRNSTRAGLPLISAATRLLRA